MVGPDDNKLAASLKDTESKLMDVCELDFDFICSNWLYGSKGAYSLQTFGLAILYVQKPDGTWDKCESIFRHLESARKRLGFYSHQVKQVEAVFYTSLTMIIALQLITSADAVQHAFVECRSARFRRHRPASPDRRS